MLSSILWGMEDDDNDDGFVHQNIPSAGQK